MSASLYSVPEAVHRVSRRDPILESINLSHKSLKDSELGELLDCLLAHPDTVVVVNLVYNRLTDKTGVKLARYLAASSTIEMLVLSRNQFGPATYLALAAALRVNSSLRELYLHGNYAADQTRIEEAFVEALRLNPDRPAESKWWLYSKCYRDLDFKRLQHAAEQLGHPSLQSLLVLSFDQRLNKTTKPASSSCILW